MPGSISAITRLTKKRRILLPAIEIAERDIRRNGFAKTELCD